MNRTMAAEGLSPLRVQEFLDDVAGLALERVEREWFNVDVAAMLDGVDLLGHDLHPADGSALLFLNRSVVLARSCCGTLQHHPRDLIHCFVDDYRHEHEPGEEGIIFRAELFSISPMEEQLCWRIEVDDPMLVPEAQSRVARWMRWLNA